MGTQAWFSKHLSSASQDLASGDRQSMLRGILAVRLLCSYITDTVEWHELDKTDRRLMAMQMRTTLNSSPSLVERIRPAIEAIEATLEEPTYSPDPTNTDTSD